MKRSLIIAALAATPALAEETRQMDAHVHGVSELDIAIEGSTVLLDLHAPGADIVGFEYPAASDAEKDAVENAILAFTRPKELFTPSAEAHCRVAEILTHLHGDDHAHDDADDHMDGDHEHDDHDDHAHGEDEHKHDDHDHGEDKHDDHGHEGHDHEDHAEDHHDHEAEGGVHSEFHARMTYDCEHPEKLTTLALPFFDVFANAKELHVAIVSDHGAQLVEAERGTTSITIEH